CSFGLHGFCVTINGPCMCTCDPALCMGNSGCNAGDFRACTGPSSCDCTCQPNSCNSYCQTTFGFTFQGSCTSVPNGDCNCFDTSGSSSSSGTSTSTGSGTSTNSSTGSGASCNPVPVSDCPTQCPAACAAQPGCTWDNTCLTGTGPTSLCGCI